MKYYLIAGERSGDLHASHLMAEILKLDPQAQFRFFGGDYMKAIGGHLVLHYKEMAFMGFLEVFLNIDKIFRNLSLCKQDIMAFNPDAVILIDYSGFNLKIAKFLKKKSPKTPIHYYIAPKIWAWNTGRAKKIKKWINHLYCILPFEKDFYKKFDFEADYVGNPTLNEVENFVPNTDFYQKNQLPDLPIIAVLPGSRKAEVEYMLHYMVSILPAFPHYQFVIAGVTNLDKNYYSNFEREGKVTVVFDQTYDLLSVARAAVVTSGTATLETALFNVPQVICYATSFVTYSIIRALIKVKYIGLPNLIANKPIVKELIQDEFSPPNLLEELQKIVEATPQRQQILADYGHLKQVLGSQNAAFNTAKLITQRLNLPS